jgi:hypothetical protein
MSTDISTDVVIQRPLWLPQSLAEIEHLANIMASAKLVPQWFQKSPGDCMLVIRLAMVWDMDPFLLAQECFSINGKLMPSGKLAAAVINTRGKLAERLNYEYTGEGESRIITVIGRLASESKPRQVEVKYKDAKTANEQWKKQPDQQLMYAGARTWGRRHVPELMLGVTFAEEADAFTPLPMHSLNELPKIQTPHATTAPARSMDEVIDPETGEVTEVARPYKIEAKTWADLIGPLTDAILNCRSIGEYDEWITANQDALLKMKETKPDLYKLFEKNIDAKRAELNAKYEQERSNV